MSVATPSQPPIMCTCMSARPGISTLPRRSVTRAPSGMVTDAAGPADTMRSLRTTTVACSTAAAPVPSISTALVKACTAASVRCGWDNARLGARGRLAVRTATPSTNGCNALRRCLEVSGDLLTALIGSLLHRDLSETCVIPLLEEIPCLEADCARLIDHESRLAWHLRADEDGIAEVRMLVGEVFDERRDLQLRAARP